MKHLSSSVVKKQIMGVTGLLLCGFLLSHLIGNCLIYVGPKAFNSYAHALITNPLIYVAEAVLAIIFLTHVGIAMRLTLENSQARPEKYFIRQKSGHGATFASSTMPYTGIIILIFLVLHIINFKFGPVYMATYDGVDMRDLHKLMIEYFANPLNVAWYIFAVIAVGIHVSHGFWSAFQSIGFSHPKYNGLLQGLSKAYALLITVGFSALPIWCFMQGGI